MLEVEDISKRDLNAKKYLQTIKCGLGRNYLRTLFPLLFTNLGCSNQLSNLFYKIVQNVCFKLFVVTDIKTNKMPNYLFILISFKKLK